MIVIIFFALIVGLNLVVIGGKTPVVSYVITAAIFVFRHNILELLFILNG